MSGRNTLRANILSNGPGRVQRPIEAAFRSNPSATYDLDDLVAIAFPEVHFVERKHRVSVRLSARRAAVACSWSWQRAVRPGHPMIYFNPLNLRSRDSAQEQCRYLRGGPSAAVIVEAPDLTEKQLEAQPGGAWWHYFKVKRERIALHKK